MALALEQGVERVVEFGPGKVLVGLMKRIAQQTGKSYEAFNVNDSTTAKAFGTLIQGAAK